MGAEQSDAVAHRNWPTSALRAAKDAPDERNRRRSRSPGPIRQRSDIAMINDNLPYPREAAIQPATMTVRQAAQLLGISVDTAYESIRRGQLPALRFGRRLVCSRRVIEQLLDAHSFCVGETNPNT